MSDENTKMIDLARRAVACKGWRWMPGMWTRDPRGFRELVTGIDSYDGESPVAGEDDSRRGIEDPLPDLSHPGTLGCLLALVREAWGEPDLGVFAHRSTARSDAAWCVGVGGVPGFVGAGPSEAEALVAALEAAARVI